MDFRSSLVGMDRLHGRDAACGWTRELRGLQIPDSASRVFGMFQERTCLGILGEHHVSVLL